MDVASQKKTDAVGEAKQRLRLVSAQFDPFAVVKRKPLRAAGTAFLAGLVWGALRHPGKAAVSLLPLAVQIAGLAARWSLAASECGKLTKV